MLKPCGVISPWSWPARRRPSWRRSRPSSSRPTAGSGLTFQSARRGAPASRSPGAAEAVAAGTLGLDLAGSAPLGAGLKVVGTPTARHDETYPIPVGKTSSARDHHRELVVALEEAGRPRRKLDLAFRAFDDGVAFRYQVPAPTRAGDFTLLDERTRFTFPGDPTAHALPLKDYTTSYEAYYKTLPVSPDRRPTG